MKMTLIHGRRGAALVVHVDLDTLCVRASAHVIGNLPVNNLDESSQRKREFHLILLPLLFYRLDSTPARQRHQEANCSVWWRSR